MKRCTCSEGCIAKIKTSTRLIGIEIREETYETTQTHHKDKVEVGIIMFSLIQPFHTRTYIIIEVGVLLLTTRDIIKEFRKEEKYSRLHRIKRYRAVRTKDTHFLYTLQRSSRTVIKFKVE